MTLNPRHLPRIWTRLYPVPRVLQTIVGTLSYLACKPIPCTLYPQTHLACELGGAAQIAPCDPIPCRNARSCKRFLLLFSHIPHSAHHKDDVPDTLQAHFKSTRVESSASCPANRTSSLLSEYQMYVSSEYQMHEAHICEFCATNSGQNFDRRLTWLANASADSSPP